MARAQAPSGRSPVVPGEAVTVRMRQLALAVDANWRVGIPG
jgi:hypothetical protein